MPEPHDLFEIMTTTRSMRRLKPDPVPDELIRKVLEAGTCAPSGGNMQLWRFLVVKDNRRLGRSTRVPGRRPATARAAWARDAEGRWLRDRIAPQPLSHTQLRVPTISIRHIDQPGDPADEGVFIAGLILEEAGGANVDALASRISASPVGALI
jgi:nitroreductase